MFSSEKNGWNGNADDGRTQGPQELIVCKESILWGQNVLKRASMQLLIQLVHGSIEKLKRLNHGLNWLLFRDSAFLIFGFQQVGH